MEGVDGERTLSNISTARKLRDIADALEAGKSFRVQINGRRVIVPWDFQLEVDLDTPHGGNEIAVELWWNRKPGISFRSRRRRTAAAGMRPSLARKI